MSGKYEIVPFWWCEGDDIKPEERTRRLVDSANYLVEQSSARREEFYFFGSLYGGFNLKGFYTGASRFAGMDGWGTAPQLRYPLIREVVDAACAIVCSSQAKSLFMTDGEIWKYRSQAKKINKFCQGVRVQQDAQAKLELLFRESCIFGNSLLKVVPQGKSVGLERVMPWEVCVDDMDGIYGTPQVWYQTRAINRDVARSIWGKDPETLQLIDNLPEVDAYRYAWATQNRPGAIMIFEAWHLPSGEGTDDGRHMVCFERGKPIVDEPWEDTEPPFVIGRIEAPLAGMWSQGMGATLYPYQLEMSRLQQRNYESMNRLGVPMVLLPNNSGIDPEQINNEVANIFKLTGDAPTVVIPPSMIPDYVKAVDMYRQRAFAHYGLDTAMATGMKPPGLNSGVAYQQYLDHNSMRLSALSREWERMAVDLDRQILKCAHRMYKDGVDVALNSPDGRFLRTIKWSEIGLDSSKYTLLPYPTNILGSTPAGKLDRLMTMTDMEWIDKRVAKSLVDLPDLEGWAALENAPLEYVNKLIENALYEGEAPDDPDQYMAPYLQDLAIPMVLQAIKRGEIDGAPEENVELLREWLSKVDMLLNGVDTPPPDPMMPPMPPGDPVMPPIGPDGTMVAPEGEMPLEAPIDPAMGMNEIPPEMMG